MKLTDLSLARAAQSARPAPPPFTVAIQHVARPKRHLLVVEPEDIREEGGRVYLRTPGAETWEHPPPGAAPISKADITEEHLDMVLEVQSVRVNQSLVDAGGAPRASGFPVRELGRWDLREFIALHEKAAGASEQ